MERSEILAALIGVGVGLLVGWFVWRFRSLSRDAISRLEGRVETAERRLARSEKQRAESELQLGELESGLAEEQRAEDDDSLDPLFGGLYPSPTAPDDDAAPSSSGPGIVESGVVGLSDLPDDEARVATLAERLTQSQAWLEEAENRAGDLERRLAAESELASQSASRIQAIESRLALTKEALVAADGEVQALTAEVVAKEAILADTRRSIADVQQHVQAASDTANGVIDLRRPPSQDDAPSVLAPVATAQLLQARQAEVSELRSKIEAFEGDIDRQSAESEARLALVQTELATAQASLEAVGDASERAAHLQDEVARLRALVADHSVERDRLSSQLAQRDQIDNKLDALFVEIHELRGRSAALRSGTTT